jgi:hypothetical protein
MEMLIECCICGEEAYASFMSSYVCSSNCYDALCIQLKKDLTFKTYIQIPCRICGEEAFASGWSNFVCSSNCFCKLNTQYIDNFILNEDIKVSSIPELYNSNYSRNYFHTIYAQYKKNMIIPYLSL